MSSVERGGDRGVRERKRKRELFFAFFAFPPPANERERERERERELRSYSLLFDFVVQVFLICWQD
jgi:hypothetical protein